MDVLRDQDAATRKATLSRTYQRWESGHYGVQIDPIYRFAEIVQVDLWAIIFGAEFALDASRNTPPRSSLSRSVVPTGSRLSPFEASIRAPCSSPTHAGSICSIAGSRSTIQTLNSGCSTQASARTTTLTGRTKASLGFPPSAANIGRDAKRRGPGLRHAPR